MDIVNAAPVPDVGCIEYMKSSSLILMLAVTQCGCFREPVAPSGQYVHSTYLRRVEETVPIYSTGSIRQVEIALKDLLTITEEYQEKAPHVWAYDWYRGVTQGRLALLYEQTGDATNSARYMTASIASLQRYAAGKNTKGVESRITGARVRDIVSKLDANMRPQWKQGAHMAAPQPERPGRADTPR